jgi:hypothetical protein
MKLKENAKIILIVLILMTIGVLCSILPVFFNMKIGIIIIYFFGYIMLSMIILYIAKKYKNKLLKRIATIFSASLAVIHLILSLILPTAVLLFNTFILVIITFGIPFILMNQIEIIFDLGLKISTMFFLCISIASILSVYASKFLLKVILKYSPIMMDTYAEGPKNKYFKELTALFYQKNNIIFCIYFFYFVYLGIMSFLKIQYGQPVFPNDIDTAILQSFLVFIAFTNMFCKSKDVQLAPKLILRLYAKIILREEVNEKLHNSTKE